MLATTDERIEPDLNRRITMVSRAIKEAVTPIVRELAGSSQRPAVLARRLGIDKSLCGRVLRSVKAEDPFEVIHAAPAPYGLRIFLGAAVEAGIGPAACGKAEESITLFEELIGQFANGRTALEAAISDHIPEVRERNERAAKQAVYKSMSYVLGYDVEVVFFTLCLVPSAHGDDRVDAIYIQGKYGMRRLRRASPIRVFGTRRYEAEGEMGWTETLDGRRTTNDATEFLLTEFCDKPLPQMAVLEEQDLTHLVLSPESLPLNSPITVVAGYANRRGWQRYRSPDRTSEWSAILPRIAARVFIHDFLIHPDVYPGVMPEVRARMHGLVVSHDRPRSNEPQIDEVDLATPVMTLGTGVNAGSLRIPEAPEYVDVLKHGLGLAQVDPSDFRAYRCRVVYPIPFISLTAWLPLPERR